MPIVPKEYTKNLDVNLARRLDDTLTYFNLHWVASQSNHDKKLQEKVLFCRDAFRSYWMSIEAEWEGFEPEDLDLTYADLDKAFITLGEIWSDLRW